MQETIYQKPERFWMTYFAHPNVAITIVTGDTLSPISPRHPNEVLIIYDDWYPADPANVIGELRKLQDPCGRHLYYLSNTPAMHEARLACGFNSHFVSVGCFIDDSIFAPTVAPVAKVYDAVMNARFTVSSDGQELKRHYLTSKIDRLALLDPILETNDKVAKAKYTSRSNCLYANATRLTPPQVAAILHQAHCGLILSGQEGICRASSEYLLAGLPVVSTQSIGGRDIWYDAYNARIVEADEHAVKEAVLSWRAHPPDPHRIRRDYQERARGFRERFKSDVLGNILAEFHCKLDPAELMRRHPFRFYPHIPLVPGK